MVRIFTSLATLAHATASAWCLASRCAPGDLFLTTFDSLALLAAAIVLFSSLATSLPEKISVDCDTGGRLPLFRGH